MIEYNDPMPSSNLYIYYVKSLLDCNTFTFTIDDILFKAMLLPFKEGYAVFPINHTI